MKRRKGKARKSTGRSQPIRLMIERLETRHLLAGFVSVAVPGAIETGTVDFIESASHVNVKVTESACTTNGATQSGGSNSNCRVTEISGTTFHDATSGRSLSVGDGFGFNFIAPDVVENDSSTNKSTPVVLTHGPFPQPVVSNPVTIISGDVVEANLADQPSQPDLEETVSYSGPQPLTGETGDQPSGATAASVATTAQPRIVPLARTQLFSLLSPADLPALDGSRKVDPLVNPLLPVNNPVDSVFEDLDDDLDLLTDEIDVTKSAIDVSELDFEESETGFSDATKTTKPLAEPNLDHLSTPALGVFPIVPVDVLDDVLQSMVVEEFKPSEEPVEEAPVNPDLPANETDDEEFVAEIYLVEGVILLAAFPSSLTRRRDDESLDEFSV